MRVRVLGAAAGGGFPQWNCACACCTLARAGDPRASPRTQDAIAASADGERWVLLNASPDVLRQIAASAFLWPRAPRHSPVVALALCNGDVDHVAGLLSLRERQPLTLAATGSVLSGLFERNVLLRTLQRFPGQLTRVPLSLGHATTIAGLSITAHGVAGRPPIHLRGVVAPRPEDNVALEIAAHGRRVLYAPAVASLDGLPSLDAPDVLLFDGTFWSSDELVAQGLAEARAEDMGHLPVQSSLGALAAARARRKVYVHVNNTNPILVAGSRERLAVEAAGCAVAFDGMELDA
ncbi:MAG: pyrroloquinoline quinone biosynthesis protein PqqB [Deltaproteobacteria bacterium]|nr:pyrroloquinoline quinone biosynthesis protein PqqB [Deltaproteobacteria bacterium]